MSRYWYRCPTTGARYAPLETRNYDGVVWTKCAACAVPHDWHANAQRLLSCSTCGRVADETGFYHDRSRADEYSIRCKTCDNRKTAAYLRTARRREPSS